MANSIKYRDPSKQQPFVKLDMQEDTNNLIITVEDNGLGIPEERQGEVFEMFKRFHPRVGTGSGLGISIVKKQVDRLGGTINFTSSDAGTTFEINIPKM